MAEVLGDLGPEEIVATHSKVGSEAVDSQSFTFDTREEEEELPSEMLVEQPVEVVEPVEETPIEVRGEYVEAISPPRDISNKACIRVLLQTPPTTQSSSGWTTRFYERFVVKARGRHLVML